VDKTRERISIYDLKPHSFEEPDVENGVKEFQENHGKRSAKLLIPPIGEDFSAITKYFEDLLISECGPSKPLQIAANDSAGSRKDFIGKLLETVQNCLNPPKDESFMTLEQTLEKVCSVRHFDGKQEREDTPDNASNSVERDVSGMLLFIMLIIAGLDERFLIAQNFVRFFTLVIYLIIL
jgi:hypothetical protein